MMKNTVDPMAVQSGVLAALMAQKGYTGTEAVFDGKEGLMDVFGPDWAVDKLVGDLGKKFKILECGMKAFPTEALTHTHLSAVLKAIKDHDIKHDQIKEVVITTIARACDIHRPRLRYSLRSAQISARFPRNRRSFPAVLRGGGDRRSPGDDPDVFRRKTQRQAYLGSYRQDQGRGVAGVRSDVSGQTAVESGDYHR